MYNFFLLLLAQYTETNGLSLGGLFDGLKVNAKDFEDIINKFKSIEDFKEYTKDGVINWDDLSKSIGITDTRLRSYLETLDDGKGHIDNTSASVEGMSAYLEKSGNGFQFAAIKATLLNTALNAGIFLIASLAIQSIAKALDNYIHRVEKATEKTEEINSRIEEFNSTHKAHVDLVENVAKRYEELSKGINRVDNSNISLSDDDYAEFLDISNQLVDAFPELYDGLDKNGNAILNIGTSAHSASEFLQELIDKEEQLTNVKIANELDDLFKNVSIQIEDAEKTVAKFDNELKNLDTTWQNTQAINSGDILDLNQLEVGDNVELQNAISRSIQQLQDELHKQLEENKIDADTYLSFVEQFVNPALYEEGTLFNGYVNLMSLSENEKTRLQEIIKEQTKSLMEELEDSVGSAIDNMSLSQQNLDAIWVDFIPDLISAMKSKANFKELDDVGLGDFAISLVENLDSSIVNELKGTAYEHDIYGYVRDKILVPLQNAIKDESGEIDTTKLENVKQKISEAMDLKASFDQNDISLTTYIDEVNELISVLEELGMSPDIIKNVKILFNYDDVSDVQKRMNNSINEISGYQQDNFGRGLNNKQTLEDKKKLQDYINKLTKEEYQLWLEVTSGIQGADNAIKAFETSQETALSSLDPLNFNSENFSSVVDALASVQSLYADFKEKVDEGIDFTFDFSDIEGLRETFTNLGVPTAQFDAFEKVLSSSSMTASEAQAEFNAMATSIIYSTGCLDGLNSSNRDLIVSQLELQGILNASSVVTEELAMASEVLAQNGYSLADASETAYWSILNEAGASETTKASLYALNAAEIAYSNNGFSTQEKIDKLGNLAKKYGDTATAAIAAAAADRVAAGHGDYESVLADMMAQVNRATQNIHIELPEVDARKAKGSASKAGKDVGKSYKDGLKEQLSDLDSVISGITSRIDDNIETVRTQKEEAVAAIDAQIDALNEQKSALEDQKKALEEERDARIEIIEQQKKQLELAIKAIDKQIKQKEKVIKGIEAEIKAMKDANEQRKLQLNLQREQYELERLQNQRTILQYSSEKGMHYVQDTKGIRDQKEKVDDAKLEIEIANKQKQIDLIEKEIDLLNEKKDAINEQIEILDEQKDQINEFYDKQIKAIDKQIEAIDKQIEELQKQKEETEKYYESLIENMEKSKSKYEELTELVGKAELSAKLKQLGIDEEALVNGSEEEFEKLKNAYMDIVFKLNEGNDEVLNKLRELSGYEGTAPAMLEDSNIKLGTMNDELGNANTEVGKVNASLGETATTTGNVATNVSDVNTNIGETTGLVNEQKGAFDELKQTIDLIVDAINQKIQAIETGQSTVATAVGSEMANFQLLINKILEVKEKLDEINTTVSTMDRQPIDNLANAFQLLYDKVLLVSNLLGVGVEGAEEGAVSGITGAIQALNEISLEEGIIAQFTNLKEAIDSVTAAISGGGGDSSEGEGFGSESGSKGGMSGGKGSEGKGKGESGGGNSLTGAIKEMGDTAQEVIGEPDAEGDGTVIGEFGSMETAVNDVRDAIGTEGSESSEGGSSGSGGETDDTLVGSIEYLGDKTEEEMGESGGDGIIGRFEEFRDVIGETDSHVQSINTGLDEIDGKEVSCTIHVNIETSGSTGFTGSAQVLGSMNLNSATYNAQYKGNAHYEGTAEVTGDWGVKKGGTTLVGELGQELVVFPNGRFKTIGDNGAEFVDIPANSIVFNHLQTKELLSKGNIVGRGRALASGTALANGTTINSNKTQIHQAYPEMPLWERMEKCAAALGRTMDDMLNPLNSLAVDIRKETGMRHSLNSINNVSNITNSRNVQQPVVHQQFNITMPNVTDSTSAATLMNDLQSLATKKFQVDW